MIKHYMHNVDFKKIAKDSIHESVTAQWLRRVHNAAGLNRWKSCFCNYYLRKLSDYDCCWSTSWSAAYRAGTGIGDANLFTLNTLYKHLEKPRARARFLFVNFSSAFNFLHLYFKKVLCIVLWSQSDHIWNGNGEAQVIEGFLLLQL